jgi:poly(A) polymerase
MTAAYYGWAQRRIEERPLVNGHDIMRATGLPPGRELGRVVKAVREAQLEGSVGTPEQALAYARDLLAGSAAEHSAG